MQSGELDAASAYKIQPAPLKFRTSRCRPRSIWRTTLCARTTRPPRSSWTARRFIPIRSSTMPPILDAVAAHTDKASAFVAWLTGAGAGDLQTVLLRPADRSGDAPRLKQRRVLDALRRSSLRSSLLYPLAGLFVPVGAWRWKDPGHGGCRRDVARAHRDRDGRRRPARDADGAVRRAQPRRRERLWWQAVLLVSVLLPPLALGILLSLAFGSARFSARSSTASGSR